MAARYRKTDEKPLLVGDDISMGSVPIKVKEILGEFYSVDDFSDLMADFMKSYDDTREFFNDTVYMVKPKDNNIRIRVWIADIPEKCKIPSGVVVMLSRMAVYNFGLQPVKDSDGVRHVIISRPDIGYFYPQSLGTLNEDLLALLNDGPYRHGKTRDNVFYHVYGNIFRNKRLDGVKVLGNLENMQRLAEKVDGTYASVKWRNDGES